MLQGEQGGSKDQKQPMINLSSNTTTDAPITVIDMLRTTNDEGLKADDLEGW